MMEDDQLARGVAAATDTRRVVLERGALGSTGAVFRAELGGESAVVVADVTTYAVAGRAVEDSLRAAGVTVLPAMVFPAKPRLHADYEPCVWLRDQLAAHEAIPVAVGSGTINDVTKLASHLAGRGYMVMATAASMDGYAAFGAAITRDGAKQTMACAAPRAIVADVDVLAAAPVALSASGFGDLIGKITAGADWMVADALGVEAIDGAVWELVQPAVRRAIQGAAGIRSGDPVAVADLFRCLVMSGLAMQAARSSRPASGAEHQLSHLWEMRGLHLPTGAAGEGDPDDGVVSHGFKVGVGTVAVAELYEYLLRRDLAALDVEAALARWPSLEAQEAQVRRLHPEAHLCEYALGEIRAKYLEREALRERLVTLRAMWPDLRPRLEAQVLPAAEVRRLLVAAGCPSEPEEIGLAAEALPDACRAARQIRRRYTSLDLAAETGLLDVALAAAFKTAVAV